MFVLANASMPKVRAQDGDLCNEENNAPNSLQQRHPRSQFYAFVAMYAFGHHGEQSSVSSLYSLRLLPSGRSPDACLSFLNPRSPCADLGHFNLANLSLYPPLSVLLSLARACDRARRNPLELFHHISPSPPPSRT